MLDGIGEEFLLKNPRFFSSACREHSEESKLPREDEGDFRSGP